MYQSQDVEMLVECFESLLLWSQRNIEETNRSYSSWQGDSLAKGASDLIWCLCVLVNRNLWLFLQTSSRIGFFQLYFVGWFTLMPSNSTEDLNSLRGKRTRTPWEVEAMTLDCSSSSSPGLFPSLVSGRSSWLFVFLLNALLLSVLTENNIGKYRHRHWTSLAHSYFSG